MIVLSDRVDKPRIWFADGWWNCATRRNRYSHLLGKWGPLHRAKSPQDAYRLWFSKRTAATQKRILDAIVHRIDNGEMGWLLHSPW